MEIYIDDGRVGIRRLEVSNIFTGRDGKGGLNDPTGVGVELGVSGGCTYTYVRKLDFCTLG